MDFAPWKPFPCYPITNLPLNAMYVVVNYILLYTHNHFQVPIGSVAFMPGKLVHTNEITVLLGDNWFAERSASQALKIVERRKKCTVINFIFMVMFTNGEAVQRGLRVDQYKIFLSLSVMEMQGKIVISRL